MVGGNFIRVKLLVGKKYWSPQKKLVTFHGFFFTDKVFKNTQYQKIGGIFT